MLEQTRRQASLFIYVLFGILIATFVYGLAPSTRRDGGAGCGALSSAEVTVDGVPANHTGFLVAYSGISTFMNRATGRQKVYLALDSLIRRELLAQAAADRGMRTTIDLAQEAVKRGYFFLAGNRHDIRSVYFDSVDDESFYNHKRWKGWVNSLNVSESSYLEEQARGLQAAMMGELIKKSVHVSRDEALADYLYENNTVTYDVVAFDPGKYRLAMRLTDADTKRFLEGHAAEVEARYKTDERLYKARKPELALREIFIPKAAPEAAKPADDKAAKPADDKAAKPADDKATKPADDKAAKPADDKAAKTADKKPETDKKPDKTADKKSAAGAANPRGLPADVAKTKLEAIRAAIAAGKLTFPDAEKQLAPDSSADAPADNGDRGWHSVDSPGLGEKPVNDAVKALKPGEMTPVIVGENGVYLVIATDKREGDLSFDQVKMEIAATLAKDVWSKEAAKRDALDTLAKAQAGTGKNLDQMFEHEAVKPPGGGLEEILNNPDLTEEQKQELLQRYLKLQQQQKHGSLDVHEQDVPVAWFAEADGSANGTAPAAGGAGSAPAPGAGGSGSAPAAPAGSAATGSPAAGAGSGSATAPTTPPAAPKPTVIEASKDMLPQFAEVPKPKVNRVGPMPRQTKMQGVGTSKDASDALFDELAPGNLAKKVYEGQAGAYVVLQLITRSQPNAADFDKTADAEITRMQEARGKAALRDWLKGRCEMLTKAGRIKPAADRIRETDDKGNPAPRVYQPCMFFDYLDG
jgi:hypothetical protein